MPASALQERARELRELDPLLFQQLLELVEQALEVGLRRAPIASCVASVTSSIASPTPEKYRSKSCSKVGRSTVRFTIVARSAARTVSRSPRPTTSSARNVSMLSASETRTPFWRSRFENSMSLSSMAGPPGLVQQVLVAGGGVAVRSLARCSST